MQKLLETGLPLAPLLPEICSSFYESGIVIVRADTGSGKSTLLPLALLEKTGNEKIILLEPRRAAALGLAARMSDLLGEKCGERVGYAVRLERKVSSSTRIEVLTDGLFIRRIQADPSLSGIDTVIFDEFHERSSMADLALAFLLDLRRMGSKVKIIIMSATMDTEKIAGFIRKAENRDKNPPVFDVPGKIFPVEISHRPLQGTAPLGKETAMALRKIITEANCPPGDILVFLPGRREINDAEAVLLSCEEAKNFEILPLHGSLPLSRQREITAKPETGSVSGKRIILSTNIAESALTIPGITLVVDSGFLRLERFHIPTAMNRLSLEEASLQSVEQRAGRAGRLGPGHCIRLWPAPQTFGSNTRPAATEPEINRIDLSGLVLECLLWGIRSMNDLSWLDPPAEISWERALGLLKHLGAVDEELNTSELGKEAAKLGLDPRLGILCLAGKKAGCPALACAAASALSDRDGSGINNDSDFRSRLAMLRQFPANPWVKRTLEIRDDLIRRLYGTKDIGYTWKDEEEADIGELLAVAFPDRIAARQDFESRESWGLFRFSSGREARAEGSLKHSGWIVAAEVDAGERSGFIRLGAPVSKETALEILDKQTKTDIRIVWKGLIPYTVEKRQAGRLLLSENRRLSSRNEAADALPLLLQEKGLDILPWEEGKAAARRFLERIRFYAAHTDSEKSNWTENALISDVKEWLIFFIEDPKNGNVLSNGSLINALKNRLGWEKTLTLNQEVPESLKLPCGKQRTINYESGEPVINVRIQDCFGISIHPKIMGIPVVFHLLSPADRPVQITSDIPGFWSGSYVEVRKDMKGRYPKHSWPENPFYYT